MSSSIPTYQYDPLGQGLDAEESEKERFKTVWYRNLWLFSTVFFAALSTILLVLNIWRPTHLGTYEKGFRTESRSLAPAIEIETVHFTGTIEFDDKGKPYRSPSPSGIEYVGEPSKEIDLAWKTLLETLRFYVDDDEQEYNFGPSYVEYEKEPDGYFNGPSVFHALHCVNLIRMIYHAEYYAEMLAHMERLPRSVHVEHCFDFLRQTIQCSGDMTPLSTRWWESAGRGYVDSGGLHTCRNIESLQKWTRTREGQSTNITKT